MSSLACFLHHVPFNTNHIGFFIHNFDEEVSKLVEEGNYPSPGSPQGTFFAWFCRFRKELTRRGYQCGIVETKPKNAWDHHQLFIAQFN